VSSPDIVIIGAGPSGILVWEQLTGAGLNAVLLEAGPSGPRGGYAPPSDPNVWAYRQARGAVVDWARIHAVGGRTVAWGGLCFRFPQSVFDGGDWPYGARTLSPDYATAEAWLGVVEGRLQPHHRRAARRLGWPVLPLRGARLGGGRPWTARDTIGARAARTRHVALGFDCSCGSAVALRVAAPGGGLRRMRARCFVLAAGPVESARLLLASGIGRTVPRVGRGLVSHPTVSYMLVESGPLPSPPSPYALLDGALVPFADDRFSLEIVGPQPVTPSVRAELQKLGLSAGKAANARVTYINGMSESAPNERSRITLSRTRTDTLGRPIPIVHLATTATDRQRRSRMKATCVAFAEALAEPDAELFLLHDPPASRYLFHEAGTCAMGRSNDAPCDPRGRLRAIDNVWIADASVFPSAGDRHPTLTILAHALRVARDVRRHLMETQT
jgi:choline dehydrogenase-like flavoprotein